MLVMRNSCYLLVCIWFCTVAGISVSTCKWRGGKASKWLGQLACAEWEKRRTVHGQIRDQRSHHSPDSGSRLAFRLILYLTSVHYFSNLSSIKTCHETFRYSRGFKFNWWILSLIFFLRSTFIIINYDIQCKALFSFLY